MQIILNHVSNQGDSSLQGDKVEVKRVTSMFRDLKVTGGLRSLSMGRLNSSGLLLSYNRGKQGVGRIVAEGLRYLYMLKEIVGRARGESIATICMYGMVNVAEGLHSYTTSTSKGVAGQEQRVRPWRTSSRVGNLSGSLD